MSTYIENAWDPQDATTACGTGCSTNNILITYCLANSGNSLKICNFWTYIFNTKLTYLYTAKHIVGWLYNLSRTFEGKDFKYSCKFLHSNLLSFLIKPSWTEDSKPLFAIRLMEINCVMFVDNFFY